jgi:lipopolysaccharide exporter
VPGDRLGKQVRSGAMWSGASSMLLRLGNVVVAAVVARLVTPRDFGVFAVALTVHLIAFNISELGVSAVLMRGTVDPDEVAPTVTTISIASSACFALLMAGFADPLARLLGSPAAGAPIRVMSIGVFLVGVFAVPGALLVREFRQDRRFLADLTGFVVASGTVLALASAGRGAMAFAWSLVFGQVMTGLVLLWMAPKRYRPGWDSRAVGSLLRFGLPLAGANLLSYTMLNVDYVCIGRLLGAVPLGFYLLAFNVASWSTSFFGAMVNGVAMPAFSRVQHDRDHLHHYLATGVRAVAIVTFPVAALTMVLADSLITTVYGSRWSAAVPALEVLALYGALRVLSQLFSNVLLGLGHTRLLLGVQLVWLGALVPLMITGVERRGLVGAGLAHLVVAAVLVLPLYAVILTRIAATSPWFALRAVAPALFASVLAGLAGAVVTALAPTGPLELLAGLAVGGVVYLAAVAPWVGPQARRLLAERATARASRAVAVAEVR